MKCRLSRRPGEKGMCDFLRKSHPEPPPVQRFNCLFLAQSPCAEREREPGCLQGVQGEDRRPWKADPTLSCEGES